ncbi:MAG: type II toxin-antitoxin system VapB family antitoxin [Verrucomicrobia bacterium]|nr:MAG: type II toxin-antitoxin system VapB family antitoxin [Verrucomicrobiota bacterium]
MKMTMHIDEALLARVMRDYEFPSKTEAVEAALKEMDRQMRLREFRANGLGLTPEELGNAVDPFYNEKLGFNVYPEGHVAEDPAPYHPHGPSDPR